MPEHSRALRGRAPLHASVNLSARQLQETDLLDQVAAALRDAGLEPGDLVLEVTETLIMQEPHTMIARLRALKELACGWRSTSSGWDIPRQAGAQAAV